MIGHVYTVKTERALGGTVVFQLSWFDPLTYEDITTHARSFWEAEAWLKASGAQPETVRRLADFMIKHRAVPGGEKIIKEK